MLNRSSHSVYDCRYHVVWTVKYRRRLLTNEHEREECKKLLRRIGAEYGMPVYGVEVDADHVHLYAQVPPQRSVGKAVGIFKSMSGRMMFKRFPYFKRKLWAGELWSDGYMVRSVGEAVTGSMLRTYLKEHETRARGPVQPELFTK
jgi:putative transposase